MGINPTERKHCPPDYMLQIYECSLYEDCCNEGCCKQPTTRINFFLDNFFYFWFAVVFMFLACSYGCYWYRHQSHFRQGSNRFRIHNDHSVDTQPHNTAQNIVRFIHEVKDRTSRMSGDDVEAPPPSYAQAVMLPNVRPTNGISIIRLSNNVEPPPSYDSLNLHRSAMPPLSIT